MRFKASHKHQAGIKDEMIPKSAHNPYSKFGINIGYMARNLIIHVVRQELGASLKLFIIDDRTAHPRKKRLNLIPINFYISIPTSICSIL